MTTERGGVLQGTPSSVVGDKGDRFICGLGRSIERPFRGSAQGFTMELVREPLIVKEAYALSESLQVYCEAPPLEIK